MQEEVDQKTIALAMKTGKLTGQVLQAAMKKFRPSVAGGHEEISGRPAKGQNQAAPRQTKPAAAQKGRFGTL